MIDNRKYKTFNHDKTANEMRTTPNNIIERDTLSNTYQLKSRTYYFYEMFAHSILFCDLWFRSLTTLAELGLMINEFT